MKLPDKYLAHLELLLETVKPVDLPNVYLSHLELLLEMV